MNNQIVECKEQSGVDKKIVELKQKYLLIQEDYTFLCSLEMKQQEEILTQLNEDKRRQIMNFMQNGKERQDKQPLLVSNGEKQISKILKKPTNDQQQKQVSTNNSNKYINKLGNLIDLIDKENVKITKKPNPDLPKNIHLSNESHRLPFYSIAQTVMYRYGDLKNCLDNAVCQMHVQIYILFSNILQKKILKQFVRKTGETTFNEYDLDDSDDENRFKFPKASKKLKKIMDFYFSSIFPDIYLYFKSVKRNIKQYQKLQRFQDQDELSQEQDLESQYSSQQSSDNEIYDSDQDEDKQGTNKQHENLNNISLLFGYGDNPDPAQNKINQGSEIINIEKLCSLDSHDEDECEEATAKEQVDNSISNFNKENSQSAQTIITNSNEFKQLNDESNSTIYQNNKELIDEERRQFYLQRKSQMSQEDQNYFEQIRQVTFMKYGKQFFIQFLDFNNLGLNFQNIMQTFCELLSYFGCKVIGEIVEQIIRSRNPQHKLMSISTPITEAEVKLIGDKVIFKYINKAKKIALLKSKFLNKAFKLFCKEFFSQNYNKILSKEKVCYIKLKKTISGNIKFTDTNQENGSDILQQTQQKIQKDKNKKESLKLKESWKNLKNYRKMWVDRVIAERQVKKLLKEKQGYDHLKKVQSQDCINQYSIYLIGKALEDLELKKQVNYADHFKKWFLNQENQRSMVKAPILIDEQNSSQFEGKYNTNQQQSGQPRKQLKLQSIFDND